MEFVRLAEDSKYRPSFSPSAPFPSLIRNMRSSYVRFGEGARGVADSKDWRWHLISANDFRLFSLFSLPDIDFLPTLSLFRGAGEDIWLLQVPPPPPPPLGAKTHLSSQRWIRTFFFPLVIVWYGNRRRLGKVQLQHFP